MVLYPSALRSIIHECLFAFVPIAMRLQQKPVQGTWLQKPNRASGAMANLVLLTYDFTIIRFRCWVAAKNGARLL